MQMPMIVNNVPVEKKEMSDFEIRGIHAYLADLLDELGEGLESGASFVENMFGTAYTQRALECTNQVRLDHILPEGWSPKTTYHHYIERFILSTNDVLYAVAAHEDDEDDILLVRIN